MVLDNPKGGLGYAAEFQSSALPYVTSSVVPSGGFQIRFAKITRYLTFGNTSTGSLYVGFTQNGFKTGNYYTLLASSTINLELRVKEVWLSGSVPTLPFTMCAGLTNIDSSNMPLLSGTLADGSAGWIGVG